MCLSGVALNLMCFVRKKRRREGILLLCYKYQQILSANITYTKPKLLLYCLDDFLARTSIVARESIAIDRNLRAEPTVPSISYSTISAPTAPLESPSDSQPYSEPGYVFPNIVTKDYPPSYAEAISSQNSPHPNIKETNNKICN